MDLVDKMERVYIPGTTRFGNIVKKGGLFGLKDSFSICLLYTSPSPRDATLYRMPSSA